MNAKPIPADPRLSLPLLIHLNAFGEVNGHELAAFGEENGSEVLLATGFVDRIDNGCLTSAPQLLTLSPTLSNNSRLRVVCFHYPPYRRRLLAILAHGLLAAGQQALLSQLETWILQLSSDLVQEINALLEELEAGGERLVELPQGRIDSHFDALYTSYPEFGAWDQALLGLSAPPPELFSVVLEKFGRSAPLSTLHEAAGEGPPALLTELPMPDPDIYPKFNAWTTARKHFHSSLPIFNSDGSPRFAQDQPPILIWQDALAEQPFYRAVIHLAFAHRLGIGEPNQLFLRCPGPLSETQIETGSRPVGRLSERLVLLIGAMGYQVFLPVELAAGRLSNLLENLLHVRILEWVEDRLQLTEEYALSLDNPPRALRLARGLGKQERDRIIQALYLAGR